MNQEALMLITLIRQLNFEELKKFYYMTKGAAVVAKETKSAWWNEVKSGNNSNFINIFLPRMW